jgi:hypothetical protein
MAGILHVGTGGASLLLGDPKAREPKIGSKDGYKGSAKLSLNPRRPSVRIVQFQQQWENDPKTPEQLQNKAKAKEAYETQISHRQQDRFARVKVAIKASCH